MLRVLVLLPLLVLAALAAPDFQRDIRPLLAKRCFACHGPDDHARMANLRLDSREGATGENGGYRGLVPGDSAHSRVIARVTDPDRPMPPAGERLTLAEVELLRQWIDEGAPYSAHWAFAKPVRPGLPPVGNESWPRNPIDRFVLSRLEAEKLSPSPEADPHTLARRVSLDLTGLPPDPQLLQEFLSDPSPAAYQRLVGQLLASPRFGERWARVWLDLARYADTQGYEKDNRRTIWPYRDWVIRAFNDNLPFDQFTIRQLAGDLLPNPSQDDLVATGFHRNTMTNTEGGTDDEEFRDAAIKDRVAVTGQVWMGLTWGCAQCHTHKYDPLTHTEYYQLYAFLNQTADEDKPDDRPTLELGDDVSTLVLKERPADQRRITHIHQRGNFLDPGAEVQPATPAAFHAFPQNAPHNRLGLAEWLVSRDNPLTARVAVNRFWARLFGAGIVETEEDFGTQGASPSHPKLLDWLAVEFMDSGWDMKALLRTIVTSATYRQSSEASPALEEKDPYNRLLARGARFRLDAEMVRDQALAVSGLLSPKLYGPPVMPWQPDGIWQVVYNAEQWETSKGEDRYRRALYTFLRRTSPYPSMLTFDAPTGETCTIRRIRTNTPLQALATLNDPVFMEAAQHLALRALRDAPPSPEARAAQMFRLTLSRDPGPDELARMLALHKESAAELAGSSGKIGQLLHYDKTLYPGDRQLVLIGDARSGTPATWSYTLEAPGAGWEDPAAATASWKNGPGQFGWFEKPPEDAKIGTEWDSEHLWLRVEFNAPENPLESLHFQIRNQVAYEAFLNGVPASASILERNGYYKYDVSPEAFAALKPGKNILAVHASRTREKDSGQVFDLSLIATTRLEFGAPQAGDADRAAWVVVANAILNLDETLTRR